MPHHCVTNKTEKDTPGGRIEHRFSFKCEFRYQAKSVVNFPVSLSTCPNFPKPSSAAAAAAKSLQSCPTLCDPHRQQLTRLPCPWDSPGKNTGVGCHFLLQKPSSSCSQSPTFRGSVDTPCSQTLVEVLLTTLHLRMPRENAAWLTEWFGNMLPAVFYALYQVFLTLYWLGPWRTQFSKVEVNNFTPENDQLGPWSSRLPEFRYSWRQPHP